MEHTFSNNVQHMTHNKTSIGGATREMTQNLLSVSLAFGLTNQVLYVIEALPGVEETLLNLAYMLILVRRELAWRETEPPFREDCCSFQLPR